MDETIGLLQMLEARDYRAFIRRNFFKDHDELLLVQFTINIPGDHKNSPQIRKIFHQGLKELFREFPDIDMLKETTDDKPTGPEGFLMVEGDFSAVKKKLHDLEESHALGRLWDFDLYVNPDRSITRSEIGMAERCCLICDKQAHECSRSRNHEVKEILEKIEEISGNYFLDIY